MNIKHDYKKELKTCPKCKKEKPRTKEYFFQETKQKDGLHYICKDCKKIIDKTSRNSSDRYKIYQKSPNFVFSQLKYQAKKRNIPFELTFDYYINHLANKPCFFCGSKNTKHWIDRYYNDHSIGYTIENSVSCCELCNKMKMSLDPIIFINQCKKIINHQKNEATQCPQTIPKV